MPTLLIERFAPPSGPRDDRTRAYRHERVADGLAGRTVWCSPDLWQPLTRLLQERAAVRSYGDPQFERDDIVMLDEPSRAQEFRERGAHAVLRVRALPTTRAPAVDAYLIAWSSPHGVAVAAVMPRCGRVAEKDMLAPDDDLAWGSLLADVVDADRDELVGGVRHARPAVSAR